MFDEAKDERMVRIMANAGLYGFFTYFFLGLLLMALSNSVTHPLLEDVDFILVVPWLLSITVFLLVLLLNGYFRTIREEATRTMEATKDARIEVIVSTIFFFVLIFLMQHFNIFDNDTETVASDVFASASIALLWGVATWLLQARRGRNREE